MFCNKATDWIDKVSRFLVCYRRKQNTNSDEALHVLGCRAFLYALYCCRQTTRKAGDLNV